MRSLVVGLGVQGRKRKEFAGQDYIGCVDPVSSAADFRSIEEVPLSHFDAALVCTPDDPKIELLTYLLSHGKHVLVEKPLWADGVEKLGELEAIARRSGAVCYTAYNHRFEPHFVRMRDLIASGQLGRIYSCRMFYGNGTARLVRDSEWRDAGAGVWPDLGSHLLDTCRYWFGELAGEFALLSADRFENVAPDHVIVANRSSEPRLELEMTLLSWRNHFTCDIFAENGSAHIASLCKWGPSKFTVRRRVLPSGRPPEESVVLTCADPTWEAEYGHFRDLCIRGHQTDLSNDRWLLKTIRGIEADILGPEA